MMLLERKTDLVGNMVGWGWGDTWRCFSILEEALRRAWLYRDERYSREKILVCHVPIESVQCLFV
jgi:hypothetical protein